MKEFKNAELGKVYQIAKEAGYDIYTYKDKKISWFKIVGEQGIGYVQAGDFGGVFYSTVHKPNRQCGTGFRLSEEEEKANLESIKNTFRLYPDWASKADREAVIKYKDWKDYLSEPTNQILDYIKI